MIQLGVLALLASLISVLSVCVRVSSAPEIYVQQPQPPIAKVALLKPPYVHVPAGEAAKIAIEQEGGSGKAGTPELIGDWWYVLVRRDKRSPYGEGEIMVVVPAIHALRP